MGAPTRWCSWLRHRATSRNVVGSILESLWCHWNFSLTQSFQPHYGIFPAVKGGRCLGLTTLPPSCADCLEIWEPHPPRKFRFCTGIALPFY
jgi:hypothetical protein